MCASTDNGDGGGVLEYDEEAQLDAAEKAAEVKPAPTFAKVSRH